MTVSLDHAFGMKPALKLRVLTPNIEHHFVAPILGPGKDDVPTSCQNVSNVAMG